jgi:hypothetical protein
MAEDMFMADALAVLEHATIKTLGSIRLPTVKIETMELKKITNEIVSMGQ